MNPQTQLDVPGWLAPAPQPEYHHIEVVKARQEAKRAQRQLEEQMFETLFEEAMAITAAGGTLKVPFSQDPRRPDPKRFLAWVMRDENRKTVYREAQICGAETVFQEMDDIADASDSIEDVARSTLRIGYRKWKLGVIDRQRFGDIKQIEQNVTVNLSDAMTAAQERIDRARTIEGATRRIE